MQTGSQEGRPPESLMWLVARQYHASEGQAGRRARPPGRF